MTIAVTVVTVATVAVVVAVVAVASVAVLATVQQGWQYRGPAAAVDVALSATHR